MFSANQKPFVICTRVTSLHSCYTVCTRVTEELHFFLSQSQLSNSFVYIISIGKYFKDHKVHSLYVLVHFCGLWKQGTGWGFDCLCWPWSRAFHWSCSPRGGDIWIFLRPTWRYLTADSDEKDWDRTYVSPLPRFTHAPYGLKRSGSHGGQWEQAKAERISLFCLQISFVLACFWSVEPLKILWYQSKRK